MSKKERFDEARKKLSLGVGSKVKVLRSECPNKEHRSCRKGTISSFWHRKEYVFVEYPESGVCLYPVELKNLEIID